MAIRTASSASALWRDSHLNLAEYDEQGGAWLEEHRPT
jgi:hypothetical protein